MAVVILGDLQEALRPVFQKYQIVKAIVFGSVGRGDLSRHSDLDLLVVQQTSKPFLDRYDGLLEEITRVSRLSVDLLIYSPEELERLADRPFLRTILKEGKVLYESGQEPASG